jgi:HEAT repeat protein
MKRITLRRRSVVVAALGLAILAVLFVASRDQGKPARYWVRQLVRNEPAARDALRELGPAAVPALIEAVSERENAAIELLRPKLPNFVRRYLPNPVEIPVRRARATAVLYDLGTNAAPAVSALIADVDVLDKYYLGYSTLVHRTLLKIGEAGVPQLIEVLQGRNPKAKAKAAEYLGLLGDKGGAAASTLGKALDDSNPSVRKEAVIALWQIGPPARSALPQLKAALQRDDDYFRLQVVHALWDVGREVEITVPILIRVLGDRNNPNRAKAAMILAEMGPAGRAAVPTLTSVLGEEFSYTRVKVEEALKEIDPQTTSNASANP